MKKEQGGAILQITDDTEQGGAILQITDESKKDERTFTDTGFARRVGGRTIRLFLCCDGEDQPTAVFVDEASISGKQANCEVCDEPHEILSLLEAFRSEWLATDHERGGFCVQSHDLMVLELDAMTENSTAAAVTR
jgi:hypothetical protein